ncbi:hypothetical protein ACPV36_11045 [Photobacterium damselae]|uniref:hypothetical protein n=1 Tax=Photobacterium damselae TaxID=38293 RepID=UPI004069617D
MSQHKLLQLIDQAKPNLQPLNTHYMAQFSVAERQDYATMLAAVITGTGTVTEAQSRLFGMLLSSMELDNDVASYYKSAQELNSVFIEKYISNNNIKNVFDSLLFDMNILLFLTQECNAELLSNLSLLFKVDANKHSYYINSLIGHNENHVVVVNYNILRNKIEKQCRVDDVCQLFNNKIYDRKVFSENYGKKVHVLKSFDKSKSFKTIHDYKINVKFNNRNITENRMFIIYCDVLLFKEKIQVPDYLNAWTEFFKDLEVKK